jgi:hypothetical protein
MLNSSHLNLGVPVIEKRCLHIVRLSTYLIFNATFIIPINFGPDPEENKTITLKYVLKKWAGRMGDGWR